MSILRVRVINWEIELNWIEGTQLEPVVAFPYLGSIVTEDATCKEDIRSRLAKAQGIMSYLDNIWKGHGVSITTKIRLMKALVWPVATYGCESWTLKKDDEQRINAFEMKGLRRILRVTWTMKKTNEWVLNNAGVNRCLLGIIKKQKLKYCGHILRKQQHSCLERDIMQGTMPERRARWRRRIYGRDNIATWTGMMLTEALITNRRRLYKIEKDCPQCDRPSERRWLKNREHAVRHLNVHLILFWVFLSQDLEIPF